MGGWRRVAVTLYSIITRCSHFFFVCDCCTVTLLFLGAVQKIWWNRWSEKRKCVFIYIFAEESVVCLFFHIYILIQPSLVIFIILNSGQNLLCALKCLFTVHNVTCMHIFGLWAVNPNANKTLKALFISVTLHVNTNPLKRKTRAYQQCSS